jgi:hypothetical protein
MQFNPKALLVLIGFGGLLTLALSSDSGTWFHVAEAAAALAILAGLAGFLGGDRSRVR